MDSTMPRLRHTEACISDLNRPRVPAHGTDDLDAVAGKDVTTYRRPARRVAAAFANFVAAI
jgi:hypothetical protein